MFNSWLEEFITINIIIDLENLNKYIGRYLYKMRNINVKEEQRDSIMLF